MLTKKVNIPLNAMIEEVMMDDPREDIVAEARSSVNDKSEIAVDLVDSEDQESISRHEFNTSSKSANNEV
jgi:hypothetical protein